MASYDHLNSPRNSPQPYGQPSYGQTQGQSPYGSGDPYYNESSGYITPQNPTKGTSKWVKIGVPLLILAIIGGVVGGVLGARHHNASAAAPGSAAAASSAASAKKEIGIYPTATNSLYMIPIYPSTVSSCK